MLRRAFASVSASLQGGVNVDSELQPTLKLVFQPHGIATGLPHDVLFKGAAVQLQLALGVGYPAMVGFGVPTTPMTRRRRRRSLACVRAQAPTGGVGGWDWVLGWCKLLGLAEFTSVQPKASMIRAPAA